VPTLKDTIPDIFEDLDFTVFCFLRREESVEDRGVIAGNRIVTGQSCRMSFDVFVNSRLYIAINAPTENLTFIEPAGAGSVTVGKPCMVLARGDGENLSLFNNSVLTASTAIPESLKQPAVISTTDYLIGSRAPLATERFFSGQLSDLIICKRALTNQEIDFVYREAIRGMSLWDWFSQAYPESDLFLEFDEPSGTTLVNRANGNGQYFGNIELHQARISSRTGLSARFDGSSAYAEIPEQCNCIQRTAVFSMGVIIKRDEESTADHWIYSTGVEDGETGFDWFLNQSGAVTFRVRGNSVTTSQVFDAGVSFDTGQDYFMAMTGNGSNLFLYVNGVLKDTKPATTVAENATRDLLVGLNKPSGSVFSPFTFGVAFITPVAMQAHEVAHIHKLTELGGYFDRPKEFLEYEITTGETPLPEPPPSGGALVTEDGLFLTTETGDRIKTESE
jgi:hypothetical protein